MIGWLCRRGEPTPFVENAAIGAGVVIAFSIITVGLSIILLWAWRNGDMKHPRVSLIFAAFLITLGIAKGARPALWLYGYYNAALVLDALAASCGIALACTMPYIVQSARKAPTLKQYEEKERQLKETHKEKEQLSRDITEKDVSISFLRTELEKAKATAASRRELRSVAELIRKMDKVLDG